MYSDSVTLEEIDKFYDLLVRYIHIYDDIYCPIQIYNLKSKKMRKMRWLYYDIIRSFISFSKKLEYCEKELFESENCKEELFEDILKAFKMFYKFL